MNEELYGNAIIWSRDYGVLGVAAAVYVTELVSHWWMILFGKSVLGAQSSDQKHDPLYRWWNALLSFGAIAVAQFLAFGLSFSMALGLKPQIQSNEFLRSFTEFLNFQYPQIFAMILGFIIYLLGFSLRLWSIRLLGRLFTFEIGIRQGHHIVEEGPYRFIRHPSYLGYLIMGVGMGLTIQSSSFVFLHILFSMAFFIVRIHSEEKMLRQHFGKNYEEYQKRTNRMIPFLY